MPTKTTYSISEVATQFQLSVPTLRYYDQQGLIPGLSKNAAGYRQFTAKDLNTLRIVECLKRTGLSIRDIKQFMTLVQAGDSTLSQRLALFQHARQRMADQIEQLEQTFAVLDYKCDYYQRAVDNGTEAHVQAQHPDLPDPQLLRELQLRGRGVNLLDAVDDQGETNKRQEL